MDLKEILKSATGLVIIDYSIDLSKFAIPLKGDLAKHYFDMTLQNPQEQGLPAFRGYWKFNENDQEINGGGIYLYLRLDKCLRQDGLWLPGPNETSKVDTYHPFRHHIGGLVLCSENPPNEQIAKRLIDQVQRVQLKLPLLLPFRSLDYKISNREVELLLVENPKGIISGNKALEEVEDYELNSGVYCMHRECYGSFDYKELVELNCSYDCCRVDWICGEARYSDLEKYVEKFKSAI